MCRRNGASRLQSFQPKAWSHNALCVTCLVHRRYTWMNYTISPIYIITTMLGHQLLCSREAVVFRRVNKSESATTTLFRKQPFNICLLIFISYDGFYIICIVYFAPVSCSTAQTLQYPIGRAMLPPSRFSLL